MSKLHLVVVGSDPVVEGRFGCDYAWTADSDSGETSYVAYRCMPHRWHPSEQGYIDYQSGAFADEEYEEWLQERERECQEQFGPKEAYECKYVGDALWAFMSFFGDAMDNIPF